MRIAPKIKIFQHRCPKFEKSLQLIYNEFLNNKHIDRRIKMSSLMNYKVLDKT